jgi:imidazolonepropionase-like amidohydrolase
MRLVCFALAAVVTAWVCRAAVPVVNHVAIQDVSVIDISASTVHPHMTVLIDGEKIQAIGAAAAMHVPPGARIVSGAGKFLIPGLWDMHVHLWYRENQLPVFIAFGVTGVQDMGSDFERTSAWRAAIETGKAVGPHIVTSGPPVTERPSDDPKLPTLVARTPAEARQAFDRLYDMDVDFIKVLSGLPRDSYFALAEQARHWHIRFEGHVPTSITAWEAIDAHQASLEHLFGVTKAVSNDEEALRFFEQCAIRDVRISPTLVLWQRMAHVTDEKLAGDPRLKYVPDSIRKSWPGLKDETQDEDIGAYKRQIEGIYKLVALATRTKVELLAGTDTGDPYTIPGATLHDELEQLVAAGLSPHQALAAATIAPARFFEWDEAMGTVEAGKLADLVLLDANPLVDIRNTRKIAGVFTRGKYHSRRDLDAILNAVNPPAPVKKPVAPRKKIN